MQDRKPALPRSLDQVAGLRFAFGEAVDRLHLPLGALAPGPAAAELGAADAHAVAQDLDGGRRLLPRLLDAALRRPVDDHRVRAPGRDRTPRDSARHGLGAIRIADRGAAPDLEGVRRLR